MVVKKQELILGVWALVCGFIAFLTPHIIIQLGSYPSTILLIQLSELTPICFIIGIPFTAWSIYWNWRSNIRKKKMDAYIASHHLNEEAS